MTLFWALAGAMSLAVVLLLVRPLLWPRTQPEIPSDSLQVNVAVYRDQLAELENDLRSGAIDSEQFASARDDLQRSLLEGSGQGASPGRRPAQAAPARARGAALVVALAIPALAVPVYLMLGAGAAGLQPMSVESRSHDGRMAGSMDEAIAALTARLEANPGDLQGWMLLGRSLTSMERHAEAVAAYENALQAGGSGDPNVLATYADVLATSQGGWIPGAPLRRLEQALAIDPHHPKSLWLAGAAAFQLDDYLTARRHWEQLMELLPPDSEDRRILSEQLAQVAALLGE
jgi:cytochrome c-type biogenesis protein CcmH